MKNPKKSDGRAMARAALLVVVLGVAAACGDDGATESDESGGSSGRAGGAGAAGMASAGKTGGGGGTPAANDAGAGGAGATHGGEEAGSAGDGGRSNGGATNRAGSGGSTPSGGTSGGGASDAGAGGTAGNSCGDAAIGSYTAVTGDRTWPLRSYYCDLRRFCCAEACFDTGLENCETTYPMQELEEALDAGTATIDEQDLAACMQALRARATSCGAALATTNNLLEDSGIPACETAIQGTVAEGDRCNNDFECADDGDPAFCLKPDEGYGFCVIARKGALGETCFMTEGTLDSPDGSVWISPLDWVPEAKRCLVQDGLYCDEDFRCFPLLPEGAECEPGQCETGLYCNETCRPLKATGAACTPDERCAEGTCLDGRCTTARVTESACTRD